MPTDLFAVSRFFNTLHEHGQKHIPLPYLTATRADSLLEMRGVHGTIEYIAGARILKIPVHIKTDSFSESLEYAKIGDVKFPAISITGSTTLDQMVALTQKILRIHVGSFEYEPFLDALKNAPRTETEANEQHAFIEERVRRTFPFSTEFLDAHERAQRGERPPEQRPAQQNTQAPQGRREKRRSRR